MKKLYEVEVSHVMYVLADSAPEAEEVAEENIRDEMFNQFAYYAGRPITQAKAIDPDWRDAIPYGGADDATCEQIVNSDAYRQAINDAGLAKR